MIDAQSVIASADIVEVIGSNVDLKRSGSEYQGLCPFHDERSPSFTVVPARQFFHCFGCGANGDVIAFVMQYHSLDFRGACEFLGGKPMEANAPRRERAPPAPVPTGSVWAVVMPAPDDAPEIHAGIEVALWNPKRDRAWRLIPERADAYRGPEGHLLGYVLRVAFSSGEKVTPQVTWCVGPDGSERWCVRPFPKPRPLCGLDDLAAKPDAPVLVVEGEKCRAAGAGALNQYAVISWAGGGKGVQYTDWSPLKDRDVVLWPDADQPGYDAMLGYVNYSGLLIDGVAQLAFRAGCRSLRMVDPAGQPKGWDIADALQCDGWTARQLAGWAAHRVKDVEVSVADQRQVA